MRKYLFISFVLLVVNCNRSEVEVFPTIDLRDTTLLLDFKNNTNNNLVLDRKINLRSKNISTNPDYYNTIENVDLYDRPLILKEIHPYPKIYTEIMKNNFDFAYKSFPNYRDSVPSYLKSILTLDDVITVIKKNNHTTKKYNIVDFNENDVLLLKISNNNDITKIGDSNFSLYKKNITTHPLKFLK